MTILERDAIISGIGMSTIGRRNGIAGIDMTAASSLAAIADAGLQVGDIDGITTMGDTPLAQAASRLGIEPAWTGGGFDTGGLLSPVMSALWAVGSRKARHVLVYRTVQMMGGTILPARSSDDAGSDGGEEGGRELPTVDWIGPLLTMHAYSASNWIAMHCRKHMDLYGTTKEQLGWLALNSRRNAALNPAAAYRDPMSLDDYLSARMISDPLGLYDCDVPVDGSIAVVISHPDHASGCPNPVVRVDAIGGATGAGAWDQRPDYPKMASVDAAAEMWSRSTLTAADIDVAELYDGFTFLTLVWLEALGLCGEGESGPFVEGAERIALSGELPLNTYGGQ